MRVLAYCLMPNHFHLVLWPYGDGDLGRWMHWLSTSHVRRHHRRYETSGHVWQGRFKAFPIEQDRHLLTVLRYVERNPVRANLVDCAANWAWSSISASASYRRRAMITVSPVSKPENWLEFVNSAQSRAELEALRRCGRRNAPYGSDTWTARIAKSLGLESSVRELGRPRG